VEESLSELVVAIDVDVAKWSGVVLGVCPGK
jgi:hypothetical protein